MLHLVNTSVTSSSQTFLPWTILRITETEHSIAYFYQINVKPKISMYECELLGVQIGHEKSSLDNVDISLPVVAVTDSFGQYLKYSVSTAFSTEPLPSGSQMPDNNTDCLSGLSSIV